MPVGLWGPVARVVMTSPPMAGIDPSAAPASEPAIDQESCRCGNTGRAADQLAPPSVLRLSLVSKLLVPTCAAREKQIFRGFRGFHLNPRSTSAEPPGSTPAHPPWNPWQIS